MAKRPADSQSDGGASEGSPASKRARTGDHSDAEEVPAARSSGKGKGKAKAKTEDDIEDGEEEVQDIALDEDEEKRFEEQHEDAIRAKVMSGKKAQSGIAEMGIIEELEMAQFMCHKYLSFKLGPQINFIIGHNGSGKSAVLSALTVALGGKATSTGRGNGLKAFIREGQSVAEVTVTLKNQGEEAYKPKEYGPSIIIQRRFTKEGSSSYKIMSKNKKVISTKREELAAICDHMNIQVDNPMNILTQDAARQFLSASAPADKYKFFLKGTQLSQLSEEYQTCLENISQTQKVLKRKSEVIPDLEDALDEATARFREANKAREQRHKADELKKELAWAHVRTKQEELEEKVKEVAKQKRRVDKVKGEITKVQEKLDEASAKVASHEAEIEALGDVAELQARREKLNKQIKEGKSKLATYLRDEKDMLSTLKRVKDQIKAIEQRIEDEKRKDEEASRERREELERQLAEAARAYEAAEKKHNELRGQRDRAGPEAEELRNRGRALDREREELQKSIVQCQEALRMCARREQNKVAQFGQHMDQVIARVQQSRWHGNRPVGPLGLYVKVKDPQKWASVMRVQLGHTMSAFAITDPRDRPQLQKILGETGNERCQIFISEVDLFDYSQGEPPSRYLTVLRALEISDDYVLRVLINSQRIESIFLAPQRKDADDLLLEYGRGGVAWSGDLFHIRRFPEGGGQSGPLQRLHMNDPRQQLFSGDNAQADRQRFEQEEARFQAQLQEKNREIAETRRAFDQAIQAGRELERAERAALQEARALKTTRDTIQAQSNDELPINVQSLQESRDNMLQEMTSTTQQYEDLCKGRAEVNAVQAPLLTESNRLKKLIDEYGSAVQEIKNKLDNVVKERMAAQNGTQHFAKMLRDDEAKLADAEDVAQTVQTEFEQWTEKAEEYCARVEAPRRVEEVQRDLDAVQQALQERERRHGASVEDMTVEVNRRKAALDTAKRELKSMFSLNRALRRSLQDRLRKWHEFRRHIALRCKVYFGYHLSNRGYFGKVIFDHVQGTLQLRVQTDDQMSTQATREKDPKSLSGGEKSFSTICLLLSLWESIGCPIRCLDEFDVFMDAVNRLISMKMMIDTASASSNKQYVLITPQDMSKIQPGPSVRVHRMSDPERGQGRLSFQQS